MVKNIREKSNSPCRTAKVCLQATADSRAKDDMLKEAQEKKRQSALLMDTNSMKTVPELSETQEAQSFLQDGLGS